MTKEEDNTLFHAMFDKDPAIAAVAKKMWLARTPQPTIAEPAHCSECFEGCPKCEGK